MIESNDSSFVQLNQKSCVRMRPTAFKTVNCELCQQL